MKKKIFFVFCIATAILALCGIAFIGCTAPEQPVVEALCYSKATNPYGDKTWQEIKDAADWEKKDGREDDIYYRFEGSYSDPYGEFYGYYTVIDCYKDGGLHGVFLNDHYYGYWTNTDDDGNIVPPILHVLRYADEEYNGGKYDVVCEEIGEDGYRDRDASEDYYEYCATVIIKLYGTHLCPCFINGAHYSPVKSLTVNAGKTLYVLGDELDNDLTEVTVFRENGEYLKMDRHWFQSANKLSSPIVFTGFDTSVKGDISVTVCYKNTDVTQTYGCKIVGLKQLEVVHTEYTKTVFHQGDMFFLPGIIVRATRDDGSVFEVNERHYKIYGFDGNTEGVQTLTVKYNDMDLFTATYKVIVYGIESFTLDARNAKKEYYIGDELDTHGLELTATFKDGYSEKVFVGNNVQVKNFDSGACAQSQTLVIEYLGLTQTYDVKIIEPTYTGSGMQIKVLNADTCEVNVNGKTVKLAYASIPLYDKTLCTLVKPKGENVNLSDEEFEAMHKQYLLDKQGFTAAAVDVYKINVDENDRTKNEVTAKLKDAPKGNTENRYILIKEGSDEAVLTYRYWDGIRTDVFVMKYKIENGIFTFTEHVSSQLGGGVVYGMLHKAWKLNADFTADRYENS